MSSAFDTPASIGSEFAELKRRIRVLETAARVPQVTSATDGVQSAKSTTDTTLSSSGAEASLVADTQIVVPVSNSGFFVILLGAEMWVSSGSGTTYLMPRLWIHNTGVEIEPIGLGYPRALSSATAVGSAAVGGRVYSGYPNTAIRCVLSAEKDVGSYTARVRYPWVVGLPI